MSGGHFDYVQYRINDAAEKIRSLIDNNNRVDEWGCARNYSAKTLEEFQKAISAIKIASAYIHRIDWLASGDDGEESFHKRLKEELEKNHD